MHSSKHLGQTGEDLAVLYLSEKGYDILDRNARFGHKEIDIIAAKNNRLILVEVKTSSRGVVDPAEMVTSAKIKHLKQAAMLAASVYGYGLESLNLELVAVFYDSQNKPNIKHYLDIF